MTDQTRWGIDQVQQINKAKAYEDQKDMREELKISSLYLIAILLIYKKCMKG
jgi:hypothetical protein